MEAFQPGLRLSLQQGPKLPCAELPDINYLGCQILGPPTGGSNGVFSIAQKVRDPRCDVALIVMVGGAAWDCEWITGIAALEDPQFCCRFDAVTALRSDKVDGNLLSDYATIRFSDPAQLTISLGSRQGTSA